MRGIDETGHRYGRLVVLEEAGRRNGAVCWLCQCDCGKRIIVGGRELRTGDTKSCGCLNTEQCEARRLPKGQAAFNCVFGSLKRGAERRGLEWALTEKQVKELTSQPCFYCGVPPRQRCRGRRVNGEYLYNGLDRVDNTRGYTVDNVVPCCKRCNVAKNNMTQQEFYTWIDRIYNRRRAAPASSEGGEG